jgi:hypothetical protein
LTRTGNSQALLLSREGESCCLWLLLYFLSTANRATLLLRSQTPVTKGATKSTRRHLQRHCTKSTQTNTLNTVLDPLNLSPLGIRGSNIPWKHPPDGRIQYHAHICIHDLPAASTANPCTKTFPCCKRLQQPLLERLTPAECADSAQAICQGTANCNALQTPPSQCRSGSTPASVRHASVKAEQSLTHERSNPTTKQPIRKAVSSRLSDSHQTVLQAA